MARFYVHPETQIISRNDQLILRRNDQDVQINTSSNEYQLKTSKWYPEFGVEVENFVLEITFSNPENITVFAWD